MFDGIENRIAQIAFGIPAVKGVEFGMGFAVAAMRGSENNDPYRIDAETGEIKVESNNAGGILGGISTGAPVMWRMAVKPTPPLAASSRRWTWTLWKMPGSRSTAATIPASSPELSP